MALSLGVRARCQIQVGEDLLRVIQVLSDGTKVLIEVMGGTRHLITEEERKEILPDVFVFCGGPIKDDMLRYSTLAFEAPRDVKITRLGRVGE